MLIAWVALGHFRFYALLLLHDELLGALACVLQAGADFGVKRGYLLREARPVSRQVSELGFRGIHLAMQSANLTSCSTPGNPGNCERAIPFWRIAR